MIIALALFAYLYLGGQRTRYMEDLIGANWDELSSEVQSEIVKRKAWHLYSALVLLGVAVLDLMLGMMLV